MKHRNTRRGFTLIELLIVVLIIGILAAVAVPQYKLAVMKSQVSTLRSLLATIVQAQEVYYLNNATYAIEFDQLDVHFPAGWTLNHTGGKASAYAYKGNLYIYVNYSSPERVEARIKRKTNDEVLQLRYELSGKYYRCLGYTDIAQKVCQSIGKYEYTNTKEGFKSYVL